MSRTTLIDFHFGKTLEDPEDGHFHYYVIDDNGTGLCFPGTNSHAHIVSMHQCSRQSRLADIAPHVKSHTHILIPSTTSFGISP